jgi:Arc/MetJ-type ribon-helix-helix transcriptional regulator
MRRTTISLPDDLAEILEREAQRRHLSVSEVVRAALLEHLAISSGKKRLAFVGIGKSGTKHTARDAEQILEKEWRGAGRG